MLGYYRDDEATAAVDLDGWFRTGDLAVQHPDGYVEIRDRAKDIIITGGENVASVEVERVIDAHPDVVESAVVGRARRALGRGPGRVRDPCGRVRTCRREALVAHVREHLAGFKVPRQVHFRRAAQDLHRQDPEADAASGSGRRGCSRMTFDLAQPAEVTDLVARTDSFVRERVLPVEDRYAGDVTAAGGDVLRVELQSAARDAGLLSPHAPPEYGGLGLGMVARAPVFEAAGCSLFGALAINAAAPDEGNMHLLAHVGSPQQKEQYLRPLVGGEQRSAFAMTEPAPGPAPTRAPCRPRRRRSTAAGGSPAASGSSPARTAPTSSSSWRGRAGSPGDRGGATMFLAPSDTAGVRSVDTSAPWTVPCSVDTARWRSRRSSSPMPVCWERSTRGSSTRRCGSVPPG